MQLGAASSGMHGSESKSMLRNDLALCFGWMVLAGCSVPDLRIVEVRDDGKTAGPPFEPRELPDASTSDSNDQEDKPDAGPTASNTGRIAGGPARNTAAGSGGGRAAAGGTTGSSGSAGAAMSGSAGSTGSTPVSPGAPVAGGMAMIIDAGAPPASAPNEPNPCLVWKKASSFDGAPDNAVEGGLETTAGIQSRQYVCRVQPPDLDYAVVGKAIFGNGCLAAYRLDGSMKTHNQQNGSPFEVLTAGPGCVFTWQKADNTSLPTGALDLSASPDRKLYACHGDFDGPLSDGVQVGGVQGAADMPPRYECWFESYTSPMQPLNPATFEVLTQAP